VDGNESGNGNDLSRFISISPSSLAANVNRAGQGDGRCKVCPGNKKWIKIVNKSDGVPFTVSAGMVLLLINNLMIIYNNITN
jgi:hypothetical protein